ncbi:MAG TPA: methyltransferase [Brevundimonas sp.]|jgi:predicted methyltransferase|uniref:class I SAM-dependent methyltransferase n=1 Tax=Brevundimonas sp. TaxID=1871086 RepID=UPI002DF375F2|nr:methyltransferase [Brevundimonas sp.]
MRGLKVGLAAAAIAAALGAAACGAMMGGPAPESYAEALAGAPRTDQDRARDAVRMTAGTLAFARVEPGDRVIDMIIGGGFFTRAFAAAVGPEGHVTAWQPQEFVQFQASYGDAVTAADALANVDGVSSPIAAPVWPSGVDVVFTAQNYHDLHLDPFADDTARRVNAAAFAALKPGGHYVIVDHHAAEGSGLAATNTLHRIDVEQVKREVLAAGFVLEGESDLLERDGDPLTANVFDDSIQGKTSQFMLRFRKPG